MATTRLTSIGLFAVLTLLILFTGCNKVQTLDFEKARAKGAQFNATNVGGQTYCQFSTDPLSVENGIVLPLLKLDCQNRITGAKVDFDIFSGFTLKNGWTVKSASMGGEIPDYAGDSWITMPTTGSSDPSGKVHLWADSGGKVHVSVRIEIQGPKDTDPYE